MSISVVYWSGTGNTQAMAEAIGEGIESAGAQANVFALGCSAMGAEELEESEMEPFVAELEGKVSGKKILLFGSYGWGDGEWMRSWVERMTAAGAEMAEPEGVIANETPGSDELDSCKAAGAKLVD